MRRHVLACMLLALGAQAVEAHEFWIEPLVHQVDMGDRVVLDLRVGEMLKGRSYPYLSHKFLAFTATDGGGIRPLVGNEGDTPSATYEAVTPGLHVVVYHAVPEEITFSAFQDFADYAKEEGQAVVIDRHRERALPDAGFVEAYTRNAKALVQVGPADPADTDRVTGLPFELVALENPYSAVGKSLSVKLLWQGAPAAEAQIAVFQKAGAGEIVRRTVRTGADGTATVSLDGDGEYLLSAVHLEESPVESGIVWKSTWASLSFERLTRTGSDEGSP